MATFLFATVAAVGHVTPLVPIARTLVQRGHRVVWYTSAHFQDRIEATGATFEPIVSAVDVGNGDLDLHFPERRKHSGVRQVVWDFEHVFVGSAPGYLTDLRRLRDAYGADVLVADVAVVAARVLAEADGVPTATVNVTVLSLEDPSTGPFGLGLPPAVGRLGRLRNRAAHLVVERVVFRPANRAYAAFCRRYGLPVRALKPAATRWLFLQPSVPELEYPQAALPPQVHFVGPLLPEVAAGAEPDWWPDLLAARDAGRPVVLVTQGTVATDVTQLIGPTLAALADEDVLVIAAGANVEALPVVPANARVSRYVPFGPLMPLVDAYVTNGGFGGVLTALANGVPMVVSGVTEDKAEVGGRVAHAGVGVNLRAARPGADRVREAVRAMLDEPGYRARAAALQRELARHDGPAEAADRLEQLARTGEPVLRAAVNGSSPSRR